MGFGLDRRSASDSIEHLNPADKSETWAWAAVGLGMASFFYALTKLTLTCNEAIRKQESLDGD